MSPEKSAASSRFSVHPGVAMAQGLIEGLKEKTGRSMQEWVRLLRKAAPSTAKERAAWLKSEHGLGTNYAAMIAEHAEGKGLEKCDPEAYLRAAGEWVEAMFSGPKSALRPIYEELLRCGEKLGKDVRVCPCKTIVPLYRKHVFAEIKPSTRTRIDLGLALKNSQKKPTKRLIDTGGIAKGDRITHRIPITTLDEVDDEVRRWLEIAYEAC